MTYTSPWHYLAGISVAAFLISLATSAQAQEQKFKAVSVKTPDGLTISVQDWGNPNGPEILFIHGFSQSHLSWIKQVTSSDLAREFHMVTYDLRGHGNSDKPLEPERYKTSKYWGDEVQAVMEVHLELAAAVPAADPARGIFEERLHLARRQADEPFEANRPRPRLLHADGRGEVGPDARELFEDLSAARALDALVGEIALEVRLDEVPAPRSNHCGAQCIMASCG